MDQASPGAAGIQVEKPGTPTRHPMCVPAPFQGIVGGGQGSGLPPQLRPQNARAQTDSARGAAREEPAFREGGAGAAQAAPSRSCSKEVRSKPCLLWSSQSGWFSLLIFGFKRKVFPRTFPPASLSSVVSSGRKTQIPGEKRGWDALLLV